MTKLKLFFAAFFFPYTVFITAQEPSSEIMKPDEGDVIWLMNKSKDTLGKGVELHIYIDHESHPQAQGGFAKAKLGVGGKLPLHKHEKTEEIAYILSGEGFVMNYKDNELIEMPIKEGYVWYNPPDVWHSFRNSGDKPLNIIIAVIPNEKKGFLSFLRKTGVEPGKEATKISPEEFKKMAAEHDMILMPPTTVE